MEDDTEKTHEILLKEIERLLVVAGVQVMRLYCNGAEVRHAPPTISNKTAIALVLGLAAAILRFRQSCMDITSLAKPGSNEALKRDAPGRWPFAGWFGFSASGLRSGSVTRRAA